MCSLLLSESPPCSFESVAPCSFYLFPMLFIHFSTAKYHYWPLSSLEKWHLEFDLDVDLDLWPWHQSRLKGGAQRRSHKPRQTDRRTDATKRIISPASLSIMKLYILVTSVPVQKCNTCILARKTCKVWWLVQLMLPWLPRALALLMILSTELDTKDSLGEL